METYTIDELAELLRAVSQSNPPFYGQTIQDWQDNKVVLFRVHRNIKKGSGLKEQPVADSYGLDNRNPVSL